MTGALRSTGVLHRTTPPGAGQELRRTRGAVASHSTPCAEASVCEYASILRTSGSAVLSSIARTALSSSIQSSRHSGENCRLAPIRSFDGSPPLNHERRRGRQGISRRRERIDRRYVGLASVVALPAFDALAGPSAPCLASSWSVSVNGTSVTFHRTRVAFGSFT